MWLCSKCGETSDDDFEVCWKCQAGRDGSPPEDLPAGAGSVERPFGEASSAGLPRWPGERASIDENTQTIRQDGRGPEYEYLVVPFIGEIKQGLFSSENAQDVGRQLQSVIAGHASQGWQFYSLEKVDIRISAGCLASLFGAKEGLATFDQIIFRRSAS